jgi:hypothetical protein
VSLTYRVLFAAACKNTHHRLALDALRHLRDPRAETWRNLFLYYYEAYLQGSKAPDDEFKDFQNHVLHVRDNYWGGATKTAQLWYKLSLEALKNGDFKDAAYSAGVLSHYFTDPFMPFHTGQTEEEGKVHRAAEWSIAQSYVELQNIIEQDLGGYVAVDVPESPTWLTDLIRRGAEAANAHYWTMIDHYNLAVGVKDPPRGLDQEMKDAAAQQIALAASGFAAVLDRLFAESQVEPPVKNPSVESFVASSLVPIFWVTKKLSDAKDRAAVQAIFDEVQATGKAVASLPEDERTVRRLHAEQVLKKPLRELDAVKPKPTGTKHGEGAPPRVRSNKARIVGAAPLAMSTPPSVPKTSGSRISLPKISLPKVSMPKLAVPKLSLPKMALPKMSMPKLSLPKVSLPKFGKKQPAADEPATEEKKPALKTAIEPSSRPIQRTDLDVRRTDPAQPAPPKPTEARRESNADDRFYLALDDAIEKAPSIGAKTARRLEALGIRTVNDLLQCRPDQVAKKLNASFITPEVLERWQRQAELVCRVPGLRGHDAQMIVGIGIDDPQSLARQAPDTLLEDVERFLSTSEGERVLRGGTPPDLDETTEWIQAARRARPLQAA